MNKSVVFWALISTITLFGVIVVYNLIPFLIYLINEYIFTKSKRKRAQQIDPKSLSSPWMRTSSKKQNKRHFIDQCLTVPQLFSNAIHMYKDKQCFGFRQVLGEDIESQSDGKVFKKYTLSHYQWLSFNEINTRIENISKGFLFIGIKPKDNVMIFAETRLEWMITCQSLLRIGSTVATLYPSLGEEGIIHGINETEVKHLVTNYDLLSKLSPIVDKLSKLRCIVYIDGLKDPDLKALFSDGQQQRIAFYRLKQIEDLGNTNKHLNGIDPEPEDTAVIMYTSGSTGTPKGVMISHKNFLTAVKAFYTLSDYLTEDDVYCAYLPLAHILEMSAELFFISNGLSVGFATIQTLTEKSTGIVKGSKGDVTLLRPTIMTTVPLILDRITKAITEEVNKKNIFAQLLVNISMKYKYFCYKREINTPLINLIFCRKFNTILGGRIRVMPCGGAPLSIDTHQFIRCYFNIRLIQGYGLTETSASATLMDVDDTSVGSVGPPLEGLQIKLIDWEEGNYRLSDTPNPRGEVVIGGHNVTKGYYKNDEMTKESYFVESGVNWFKSGDIGEMLENGSLKIIDRKKDILKLSTGEYISLAKIETTLKRNPFVDNICVFGNSQKDYLIAFIIPNVRQLEKLANSLSKPKMGLKELCEDIDVNTKVLESIKTKAIESKLSKIEIPNKIKLCSEEWVPENGLVTAALKLRRRNIQEFYRKNIQQMYEMNE